MKPPLAAGVLVVALTASRASAQCGPVCTPQAPSTTNSPCYYTVNECGAVYGPNYNLYPPFLPFQGMILDQKVTMGKGKEKKENAGPEGGPGANGPGPGYPGMGGGPYGPGPGSGGYPGMGPGPFAQGPGGYPGMGPGGYPGMGHGPHDKGPGGFPGPGPYGPGFGPYGPGPGPYGPGGHPSDNLRPLPPLNG